MAYGLGQLFVAWYLKYLPTPSLYKTKTQQHQQQNKKIYIFLIYSGKGEESLRFKLKYCKKGTVYVLNIVGYQ